MAIFRKIVDWYNLQFASFAYMYTPNCHLMYRPTHEIKSVHINLDLTLKITKEKSPRQQNTSYRGFVIKYIKAYLSRVCLQKVK